LIDEEIRRDEAYRANLLISHQKSNGLIRDNVPLSLQLPPNQLNGWHHNRQDSESAITPRPVNGYHYPAITPGLAIGVATPGTVTSSHGTAMQATLPSTAEEGEALEKRKSHTSNPRNSGDYFSSNPQAPPASNGRNTENSNASEPQSETLPQNPENVPQSPSEPDKDAKSSSLFGKKFRMTFPKKLGRSSTEVKVPVVDDKSETSEKSSERGDKIVEDNFFGVIQKVRNEYEEQLAHNPEAPLQPGINPSLPNETPVLKPPGLTTVIIQEDRPDSGGVADLYRGTVDSVGHDADPIGKAAPMWLGDLLLRVN
jgi:WD repeat-containing protein 48